MPERTAEPLSPELILVSPPELAALAREQLPDRSESLRSEPEVVRNGAQSTDPPSEVSWNDFLADVRSRSVEPVATPRPRPWVRVPRNGRRRLLVAIAAIVAVAGLVGLALARDRAQQQTSSSASSKPASPSHQATPPRSTKHAKTTPAPAVTTAPKRTKPQPRASHVAGFVPARVWSWAAAPGAGAYVVRFLRAGHEVLKIRTVAPRLVLPSRFNFTAGRYRWTVTSVLQSGKLGHVIVDSSFAVGASNG